MSDRELDEDDKKHISRLQALRKVSTHNMFTELKDGLEAYHTESEARETYEWVKDNWEYYQSGDWTEVDLE